MNIIKKIELGDRFSSSEQTIAHYVLSHYTKITEQTSKELLAACHVSSATLYRFISKLGCSGFFDFKSQLMKDGPLYEEEKKRFDYDFPFRAGNTPRELSERLYEDIQKTLLATKNLLSIEEVQRLFPAMKKARQILIFTSAGNLFPALNFRFQMMEINREVKVPAEEYEQRLTAASADAHDFAIIVSFEGRGLLNRSSAQQLHDNHVPLLLISSPSFPKHMLHAAYQLYIAPMENHCQKISSFSTRASLSYLFDILYSCYFEADYEENLQRKLRCYQSLAGKET